MQVFVFQIELVKSTLTISCNHCVTHIADVPKQLQKIEKTIYLMLAHLHYNHENVK